MRCLFEPLVHGKRNDLIVSQGRRRRRRKKNHYNSDSESLPRSLLDYFSNSIFSLSEMNSSFLFINHSFVYLNGLKNRKKKLLMIPLEMWNEMRWDDRSIKVQSEIKSQNFATCWRFMDSMDSCLNRSFLDSL